MEHLDIVIYALIAIVLLARLWAVFGRRNDSDPQRPNPFTPPDARAHDEEDVMVLPEHGRAESQPRPAFEPVAIAPLSLAGGIESVKRIDPAFDEKQFLRDMRVRFTAIVENFAKGDMGEAQSFLSPIVLAQFNKAISTRVAAGETLENHIAAIHDAETTAARAEDTRAVITVRFVSEQQNILRDAVGKIISGAPDKTEEIIDMWVFARDTKNTDAEWQLVETRS